MITARAIAAATILLAASAATAQGAQTLPVRPGNPNRPTPMPTPVPDPGWNQPQNFAGTTRCESQNHRTRTCRARTQNRVEIVQVHGGSCQRNGSFSYNANGITVSNGCRATFAYGFGNVRPQANSGPNALPWLLAGAGATAGLVAIANSGSSTPQPEARPAPAPVAPPPAPTPPAPPPPAAQPAPPPAAQGPFPALPPAKLDANIQMLTADQQRTMQTCLFEAARETGLTGGTALRLDSVDFIEQGSGGWRFRFRATGTWPNGQRQYSAFCRATPTQIVEFTVSRPS